MSRVIPYSKLNSGQFNVSIDPVTDVPLASVIEVVLANPDVNDPDNYAGRTVYNTVDQNVYIFRLLPSAHWQTISGLAVEVGTLDPPSSTPTPLTGSLNFSSITSILYLFDGVQWNPVGGEFGATILTRNYVGDDITKTFSTGANAVVPAQFIFASIDGISQIPFRDFISIGNNIQFLFPPPGGTNVYIRTFTGQTVVQNADVTNVNYTGNGSTKVFDSGAIGVSTAMAIVTVNGVVQTPDTAYTIVSQDTTITSLTRSGSTGTAVTKTAHGLGPGDNIKIFGALETAWDNSFSVLTVPTPTTFTFAISASTPTPANPNPLIYFQPATANDKISFVSAPSNGAAISIRVVKGIVATPNPGQINVGQNLGTGVGIYSGKVGVNLQFKTLVNGSNTIAVDNGDGTFKVDVSTLNLFENRVTTNADTLVVPVTASSVAVKNTSVPVLIDLSLLATAAAGRRLVVADESGGANVNNITISTGGPNIFDPVQAPGTTMKITTKYGFCHLEFDGTNWYTRGRTN